MVRGRQPDETSLLTTGSLAATLAAARGSIGAILVFLGMFAIPARAGEPETVSFRTLHPDGVTLRGFLLRPEKAKPVPAVLMLHGCSGPVRSDGRIAARERAWMDLLVADGYAVLLLDSFNPRGFASVCNWGDRPISAETDRPYDAYAALAWLRAQSFADPRQITLFGWSHGAMATLAAISAATIERVGWHEPGFRAAVAFYPGCLSLAKTDYRTAVPLLMQLGERDDWTPVRYCQRLADKLRGQGAELTVDTYPGAYHAFDNPTGGVRTRRVNAGGGERTVHLGADPAAREKAVAKTRRWLAARFKG